MLSGSPAPYGGDDATTADRFLRSHRRQRPDEGRPPTAFGFGFDQTSLTQPGRDFGGSSRCQDPELVRSQTIPFRVGSVGGSRFVVHVRPVSARPKLYRFRETDHLIQKTTS